MSQQTTTYYLIERWQSNYKLPEESKAVALTPEAVFYLEKAGISYITLEDFYSSKEIKGNIDEYFLKLSKWFDEFDAFLQGVFIQAQKKNMRLGSSYYFFLKHVIDNIVLSTRILRRFIESTKPTKIYFVALKYQEDRFDGWLTFQNTETTYSRLIEPLCQQYSIVLERLYIAQETPIAGQAKIKVDFPWGGICLKKVLKSLLPHTAILRIKKAFSRIQYLKFWLKGLIVHPQSPSKGKILLIRTGDYIYDLCLDLKKEGFEIFFKEGNCVRAFNAWPFRKPFLMEEEMSLADSAVPSSLFERFKGSPLMARLNEHCGLDVSGVIRSRFEYFLEKFCPQMMAKISAYQNFYSFYKIDAVMTHLISTIDDYAAFEAARLHPSMLRVGLAHGADMKDCQMRTFLLQRNFDIFFCLTKEEADRERELADELGCRGPQLYDYSYFQKRYERQFKNHRQVSSKPLVLFIPIMSLSWPTRIMELTQPFPMEYVQWHKALAEYFSKRQDYTFIWKAFIVPGQTFDLMADFLKEKKYKNIVYSTSKLKRWLPKVQRVLCDSPSTAFYEAVYAGCPTMTLYQIPGQELRPNALAYFGQSVQGYASVEEGLKKVEEFLNNPAGKYKVSFPSSLISFSKEVEESLKMRKNLDQNLVKELECV